MKGRDERGPPENSGRNEVLRATSQFMGHGLTFALSALLFFLIGDWADGKLGTGPILALVGLVVGASAGFYSLYRHATESRGDGDGVRDDRR